MLPSPDSAEQTWQPTPRGGHMSTPAKASACAAITTPLPWPGILRSPQFLLLLTLHSLSLWQTLLEVVKEEASSATPSSGNQQTLPSSSILPCKCCDTLHPLPSCTCGEPGWTRCSTVQENILTHCSESTRMLPRCFGGEAPGVWD